MLDRLVRGLYRRLGRRYTLLFPVAQDPTSLGIATIAVLLLGSYYDTSGGDRLAMLAVAWVAVAVAITIAFRRGGRYWDRIHTWQASETPTPKEAIEAWDAATNFSMRSFRANVLVVNSIAILPTSVVIALIVDVPWTAVPVLCAAVIPMAAYATILNYFTSESLRNLLLSVGMDVLVEQKSLVQVSHDAEGPAIEVLCRRIERPSEIRVDSVGVDDLNRYISGSAAKEAGVLQMIAKLADEQSPIYVWGTGTNALHLLASSRLAECRSER